MVDKEGAETYICIRSIVNKNNSVRHHTVGRIGIVIPERKEISDEPYTTPRFPDPGQKEEPQKGNILEIMKQIL